jgi:UDP-GlcNAc:undecaprenyl-phosphate/decaprenyl-phosphate GlcNAc-1-phosphate transferase
MTMFFYLFLMAIPLIIAVFYTPIIRRMALRFGIFAVPNHRTMHNGQVPKLGGVAIFTAFVLAVALTGVLFPEHLQPFQPAIISLLIGVVVLMGIGALDDKYDLNCNLKLSVEIAVALLAAACGWRLDTALLPGVELDLGFWSWPLTVLWMVGVTNAINMVDGLDGLAGGISLVISTICIAVAVLYGNTLALLIAPLLMGSVIGFLRYNVHPARIFMGDSGSLPLGFTLACLSLQATMTVPGKAAVAVPLLMLALPITDTVLAITRRLRRGIHPFHADREHIHHRLVKLGLSHSGAAMFMVGLSVLFAVLAFLMAQGMLTNVSQFAALYF